MAVFVWSILSICDALLMYQVINKIQFQMFAFQFIGILFGLQHAETVIDFFLPIALAGWSFCTILLICELGERLTTKFDEIDLEICFWNWYLFPNEIQRMLPIIIVGTQEPVVGAGFGNVSCTRAAFQRVITFLFICFF